jgi:AbrB family looped-hinge helix DNA binding protein
MRITAKGQLTIPQKVRERAGLMPGAEVEVIYENDVVQIRKPSKRAPDAVDKRIARFAGSGNRRHSTEELMAMLRGDD